MRPLHTAQRTGGRRKSQWAVIGAGSVLAVLAVVVGSARPRPPIAGPTVEVSPGLYRHSFVDVAVPPSAVLALLTIIVLTGGIAYSCRTRPAP